MRTPKAHKIKEILKIIKIQRFWRDAPFENQFF
jgi:hypothetical protein